MTAASRMKVLGLYRSLMRESQKFTSYNYREYALRRVRDAFRSNVGMAERSQIDEAIKLGQNNLEVIRRQVFVSQMYASDKLVIEK